MKLAPKVITGVLHAQNKGACDWGWQGLLAHGCHGFVVVIDPKTVQVIQVLERHKANVVKVKWARENYHHDTGSPYSLRLASGDANGVIVIWDVGQGEAKAEFSDGTRPIQDLEWLSCQDASRDLLVALHPPYSVILWNADTGTKLWKKSYTETFISFAFDPFNIRNVALLGQDCIVFIDDFTITKTPSSNGKKFYISSPSGQGTKSENTGSLERKASKNLARRMSKMLVGEGKQRTNVPLEEEAVALNECLQLTYHQSCRHHLILVYPREVLILDLEINQTVGIIPMERTGSPFVQVVPLRQRDVLLCLHESGGITTRVRRKTNVITTPASEGTGAFDDSPPNISLDVAYDLRCQSDGLRVTRHNRVYGLMCCPVSERSVALMMSDSRIVLWDLMTIDFKNKKMSAHHAQSPLYTPGTSLPPKVEVQPSQKGQQMLGQTSTHPKAALCDMIGQAQIFSPESKAVQKGHGVALKFVMTGLLNGIVSPVTVIRMCPPLTTKNWEIYEPLLALGTGSGIIQIIHIGSGLVDREYSLHTSTVRGIEWSGLRSFLSYAYPNPGVSGLVKNEILMLDISSGKATPIRTHRDQESPIELLRISHLKQYFIIAFKEKPLELWDLRTFTMLRETGKSLPRPTALEWSPSHSLKTLKRKLLQQQQQQQHQSVEGEAGTTSAVSSTSVLDAASSSSVSLPPNTAATSENKPQQKVTAKEHFVFTDSEGTLYHFVVEGNGFTDATRIPPESGMGTITWVSWKGDFIAFGDGDGQLCLWDLKTKTSRTNSTRRGWIKKIRFAPGRGNLKFLILYNDGLDIWDIRDGKPDLVSAIKSPKEISKVVDAEWAGSDRPVLATVDGCIQVCDLSLKKTGSAVDDRELPDELFCPYLLPGKGSILMNHVLQHQPWNESYMLKLEGLREEDEDLQKAINSQLELIDRDLTGYLPRCRFGLAERCLLIARLFGDESALHFWTVALHYLRSEKVQPMCKSPSRGSGLGEGGGDLFIPQTPGYKEANDLVVFDNEEDEHVKQARLQMFKDQPLERCYDALVDSQNFQKYQLDRVVLHDSKRATYDHTRKCAENYILLGQTDRAVQLLLETEPDNESYYTDSLRACLVASIRSSGASQSTIKLVATNLIANGKLSEGVQLLCLIDKGMDSCRYLQTYGAWDTAVWLAKATLGFTDCCEVMKRWADHLCGTQVNLKSYAVLVMLSLGQFTRVVEMLYGMRQFSKAGCFIEACMQFGLLVKNEETTPLIEAVFLENARLLSNMGHRKGAEHYCHLAGEKGQLLLKEVEILFP